MKRIFTLCVFLLILVVPAFTQRNSNSDITIPTDTRFSLNPILGITGKETDPDSRFVQRIVFSTMVAPKTDPVVDVNFIYDLDVSMIDTSKENQFFNGSSWERMGSLHSLRDVSSYNYRLYIYSGFEFYYKGQFYDKLEAEDVIFSYRLAQTTLSQKDGEAYDNYTNAILRAKLGDLRSVSYVGQNQIEFEFSNPKTAQQMLEFLAYTPIVSAKQLFPSKTPDIKKFIREDNFIFSARDDAAVRENNRRYNMKDTDYSSKMRDFQKFPASYGQYYVNSQGAEVDATGLATKVTLQKNKNWANNAKFSSRPLGLLSLGKHADYQNEKERLIVVYNNTRKGGERLKNIEDNNSRNVISNMPLTSRLIQTNNNIFNSKNYSLGTEKMHISYKLYGLIYSPRIRMFDPPENRAFFRDCLNRSALIELIKGTMELRILSKSNPDLDDILNHIEITDLYYPFYEGSSSTAKMDTLTLLHNSYKEKDHSMGEGVLEELKESIVNYTQNSKAGDISEILSGVKIQTNLFDRILENYKKIDISHLNNNERLSEFNGKRLTILYDGEASSTEAEIARFYQNNLKLIFNALGINAQINVRATSQLPKKTASVIQADPSDYEIAVYSWNYRFDFLGEFASVLTAEKSAKLQILYNDLLINLGQNSVVDNILDIAKEIESNQTITTLFGIQNYVIYDKKRINIENLGSEKLGAFAMLYPYYWLKNFEVN